MIPRATTERARAVVAALTGVRLTPFKSSVLARRLRIQSREFDCPTPEAYLDLLEAGGSQARSEAERLAGSLSANVSGFFRDPAAYDALEELAFPGLFEEAGPQGKVRVWSAACSRGQEPYSLGIRLWRYAHRRGLATRISVLGTDRNPEALEVARSGVYEHRWMTGVPSRVRREAFLQLGDGRWQVREEVRRLVSFRRGDVFDPSTHPKGRDLVACRNLLIYLRRSAQEDLILALRRALRPGGFLLLGSSETLLGRPWTTFEHVSPARRIYRRPPLA